MPKPLHVLSADQYEQSPRHAAALPADVVTKLQEHEIQRTDTLMAQKMDDYVAPLIAEGLEVAKISRVCEAREVIAQVAIEIQADLLIIGSHSKRGVLDIALGGTAQQVTKRAPCTVVLVSPKKIGGGDQPSEAA